MTPALQPCVDLLRTLGVQWYKHRILRLGAVQNVLAD